MPSFFLEMSSFVCTAMFSVDGCSSDPCLNDGKCVTVVAGSYVCQCIKGRTGLLCETGNKKGSVNKLGRQCSLALRDQHIY